MKRLPDRNALRKDSLFCKSGKLIVRRQLRISSPVPWVNRDERSSKSESMRGSRRAPSDANLAPRPSFIAASMPLGL